MKVRTTAAQARQFLPGLAAMLLLSGGALAQVAPPTPSSEDPFAIVSSTYTNTVAGTTITGNVCFTTGPAVTPVVVGTIGPCPGAAGTDQNNAVAVLNTQACTSIVGPLEGVIIGANAPGVFPPGCYTSPGALNITANGIVRLTGNGVYVFRSTGGAITTGANSQIVLAGGACAGNVFWAAAGATTLGGASSFVGNIYDAAGITMGLGAALTGRALAFGGTVTTNGANTITLPTACAALMGPAVAITKVSNGFSGSFAFTGTNGVAAQNITTVAAGVGVTGVPQALTAPGAITTITETTPPGNFTLTAISCSGLGSGGTATPNLATRTVTLDAAATALGAAIGCTFTNTFGVIVPAAIPTLSEWAMILLAGLLAIAAFFTMRRKAK